MRTGSITNIQRFCVDDGPGIRTTVFLSGCPLRCLWCHNPETARVSGSILLDTEKCLACGACAAVCKHHVIRDGQHIFSGEGCTVCGSCLDVGCGALTKSAREATVSEIMKTVSEDMDFYRASGGGVTFSGGEPTVQFDFLLALSRAAKERGIHVCLETSGYGETEKFLRLAEYVDLFLFDCKLTDGEKHLRYTGVPLEPIQENLRTLSEAGASLILRCPIIPGINDDDAHLSAIGQLADRTEGICEIHLLPYHELGNSKRKQMGIEPTLTNLQTVSRTKGADYASRIVTKKKIIL